jgi:hypothetical protein
MKTVRDAAPLFVAQGREVTANFNSIAVNIKRLTQPHWYDRLLGYGLNAAIVYRQLHPANGIVERAAEAISSQK